MRTRQKTLYGVCPGLSVRPCYAISADALIIHEPVLRILGRGSKTAGSKHLSQLPAPSCWI
ncbi:hypothetical protein CORC01_14252 [Colletotrichum orchidophilum]|uniref:Uncharacterized protein n=1 Tax=Colletotrichum orchidophilum TaxID=1209926 RepID=A0A1G4AMZ7_9PEZI|nr:uncharacterized protein CORC01_14252 [Colletotrichum orchidophilum]OHE90455.1 hypothetical protein CORC01_14252 [Colletotrichum orchidophilum]